MAVVASSGPWSWERIPKRWTVERRGWRSPQRDQSNEKGEPKRINWRPLEFIYIYIYKYLFPTPGPLCPCCNCFYLCVYKTHYPGEFLFSIFVCFSLSLRLQITPTFFLVHMTTSLVCHFLVSLDHGGWLGREWEGKGKSMCCTQIL